MIAGYDVKGVDVEDTLHILQSQLSDELLADHSGVVHVSELTSSLARKAKAVANQRIPDFCTEAKVQTVQEIQYMRGL